MNRREEAKEVQKEAAISVKSLMDEERISNKLMMTKMAELGNEVTIQTVSNYTSLRRYPNIDTLIIMLDVINNISGKNYTTADIGLKIGPSFYTYT